MNWSWADYQNTPVPVVEQVMAIMDEEAEADRARREREGHT